MNENTEFDEYLRNMAAAASVSAEDRSTESGDWNSLNPFVTTPRQAVNWQIGRTDQIGLPYPVSCSNSKKVMIELTVDELCTLTTLLIMHEGPHKSGLSRMYQSDAYSLDEVAEAVGELLTETPTSSADSWVNVRNGSRFPAGAVKVALRRITGLNDDHMPNAYVALWYKNDEPVFGRAHNVDGVVVAYFPLDGIEWHSYYCGDFKILVNKTPNSLSYDWVTPDQAVNQLDSLVCEGDCCPALVLDCVYDSPRPLRGDLLGKASLQQQKAWTCFAGIEREHGGEEYHRTVMLVRKP